MCSTADVLGAVTSGLNDIDGWIPELSLMVAEYAQCRRCKHQSKEPSCICGGQALDNGDYCAHHSCRMDSCLEDACTIPAAPSSVQIAQWYYCAGHYDNELRNAIAVRMALFLYDLTLVSLAIPLFTTECLIALHVIEVVEIRESVPRFLALPLVVVMQLFDTLSSMLHYSPAFQNRVSPIFGLAARSSTLRHWPSIPSTP